MLCDSEQTSLRPCVYFLSTDYGAVVIMNDWARVLQHTKRRLSPCNFATWFRPTRLKGRDRTRLVVRVPARLCKKRLTETYGELLHAVLIEVGLPETQLKFICAEPESPSLCSTLILANEHEALKKNIDPQDGLVTIKMIQKRVGELFGVFPPDLKLRNSSRTVVFPCQVAMYLVKQLTSASLPKIGREFGGKHHTTVLSSIKTIEARRRTDIDLNRTIGKLFDSLQ
jgi:chromosomal replication initiation ATPase DnaA